MAEQQTFLFADLSGFTALTEAHGDEEAADLVAEFTGVVRDLLPEHAAREVKTIGDAVMIRCSRADAAVELGLRIVEQIGARDRFPSVRVGMHSGPAAERGGDYIGATVNLAARVAGVAPGGQVLLTASTREAAGDAPGIRVIELGREVFRNVVDPVLLFRARRSSEAAEREFPVDPVCRMGVDPVSCAGVLRYQGAEFHFCSLECVRAFAADPDRYAGQGDVARGLS
jgi:adenylate cyclase